MPRGWRHGSGDTYMWDEKEMGAILFTKSYYIVGLDQEIKLDPSKIDFIKKN